MVLDQIVENKLRELALRKRSFPLEIVKRMALEQPAPLDLTSVLSGDKIQLIAEVKKASPSRGIIRADFNPVEIVRIYVDNGASTISVLTENKYFQGSLDYLRDIKKALGNKIPLLRKDFITDPYQVYESLAYGANSLLLIVAILTPEKLNELLTLSHQLGMHCLVEVHNEAELKIALDGGTKIIGINNRDLRTFTVDLAVTERLRPLIPADRLVVSESGIKSRADIKKLEKIGVNAVLIGEALLTATDIAARIKELW